jgi:hypothetical protein
LGTVTDDQALYTTMFSRCALRWIKLRLSKLAVRMEPAAEAAISEALG